MSRCCAWSVHLTAAAVGLTGLVYGWMLYFAEPVDEFSVVNHPWQPDLQWAHLVLAPALVFACGAIWRAHVWVRLRSGYRKRRGTGLALAILLAPMVASGYLLQGAVEDDWRAVWVWTHGVSSTLWLAAYAAHQIPRRAAAAQPHTQSARSRAASSTERMRMPPA